MYIVEISLGWRSICMDKIEPVLILVQAHKREVRYIQRRSTYPGAAR